MRFFAAITLLLVVQTTFSLPTSEDDVSSEPRRKSSQIDGNDHVVVNMESVEHESEEPIEEQNFCKINEEKLENFLHNDELVLEKIKDDEVAYAISENGLVRKFDVPPGCQRLFRMVLEDQRIQRKALLLAKSATYSVAKKYPLGRAIWALTLVVPDTVKYRLWRMMLKAARLDNAYEDMYVKLTGYPSDTPVALQYRAANDHMTRDYRFSNGKYIASDDEIYAKTNYYPFPETPYVVYRDWARNPEKSPLKLKQ